MLKYLQISPYAYLTQPQNQGSERALVVKRRELPTWQNQLFHRGQLRSLLSPLKCVKDAKFSNERGLNGCRGPQI